MAPIPECVSKNGRGVNTDSVVPGTQTSLTLNDLGESCCVCVCVCVCVRVRVRVCVCV